MYSIEEFRKQLRSTLNHLYDPDFLRRSPLVSQLNISGRFDTPVLIQRTLEDAIEKLRPGSDLSINSHAWHMYDILVSRYIHQLSQEEVANQIGVSTRQLVREQDNALDLLAGQLWNEFGLSQKLSEVQESLKENDQISDELNWLKGSFSDQLTDLREEIEIIMGLVQPMTQRYNVKIDVSQFTFNSKMPVHPVAFRQVLISVISVAIYWAKDGFVEISFSNNTKDKIEITVLGKGLKMIGQHKEKDEKDLLLAQEIINLIGGEIEIKQTIGTFYGRLLLPAIQPVKVLVIDDNADFLSLFQRFTSGTHFDVVSTRKPDEIFALIETEQPKGIILDIMMPEMDGWQILAKIHHHPLTNHIPVIICSIVSNEELASTLGASGYLRKPISRDSLLKVLEKFVEDGGRKPD